MQQDNDPKHTANPTYQREKWYILNGLILNPNVFSFSFVTEYFLLLRLIQITIQEWSLFNHILLV